jgi:uncharacterized RDD family membrane protein YckC
MKNEILPVRFEEINDNIYAGFWSRLGSQLLDFLILIPYILILNYLNGLSITMYQILMIPNLIFIIWYNVYLVRRFGGTPGKLIVGIKIVNKNGNDINMTGAILRYIVSIGLSIFGFILMISILQTADEEIYQSLGFWKRSQYISELNPQLIKLNMWLSNIWIYSELIVLLTNKRKRSIHDFMANSVVIKSKYLDKIKEILKSENE